MTVKPKNSNKIKPYSNTLLRENELDKLYLDIAGVMIIALDAKGVVTFVNKKASEILSLPKEKIIGKNWFKNFVPQSSVEMSGRFKELMSGKQPDLVYENSILTGAGKEILISWHTSLIENENGKIDGIISSGQDITESRNIQDALVVQSRNSEFMYLLARGISDTSDIADLLEKAANILVEYRGLLGGKLYVFTNSASTRISDEIEFGSFKKIMTQNGVFNNSAYLTKLLESQINCVESVEYSSGDESLKAFSCAYKMNTKYETHGVLVVLCENIDSTLNDFFMLVSAELGRAIKRKKVEIEIKESEEKFTTIFNFMPDALTISGIDDSHFLEVNRGFEELTGYTREEALNKSALRMNTWVHPDQRKMLVDEVINHGKVTSFLASLKKKDGTVFDALFSAALLNINGIKSMLTSVRDISDRIKIENEILNTKELLEKITFTTPSFISLYDVKNDRIIYSNKSLLMSLGYTAGDLEVISSLGGENRKHFYHEDDRHLIDDFGKRLAHMEEGEITTIDYRIKDAKSVWQWFQHSAAIFQKAKGNKPLLTVNVFMNISERKAAEESIRRHSREIELLYEAGKQISSSLDLDEIYDRMYSIISQVAECSELIVTLYDPQKQEINYKYLRAGAIDRRLDVSNIPPIPLAPKGFGIVSEVIRSGESIIIDDYSEYYKRRVKTKYVINEQGKITNEGEGSQSPRSAMIIPIKLENKVLGAVQIHSRELSAYSKEQVRFVESLMNQVALANRNAVSYERARHEIQERKAAQEELKKSERNLRQFAESVPDVLFRLNHVTKEFDFLSPVIENMLGYELREALENPYEFGMKVIHPQDFENCVKIIKEYVKHGRVEAPLHVEARMKKSDGSLIWVRTLIKFEYKAGKIHAIIGAMTDITREKQQEERRRATDEKIIRHQSTLLELSRLEVDLESSYRNITENTATALKIDRASIWLFNDKESLIECNDLFISSDFSHSSGQKIGLDKSGGLYRALMSDNLIINKKSIREEELLKFANEYLFTHGTTFALISPIRSRGQVVGSLCIESNNEKRVEWLPEELDFVISVTGLVTLAMESNERRKAEEEIKRSLKDKEMLLREIHHRVKNNMQVISSILFLQAKKSKDPALVEGLIESQNRVKSMVMIHEKLYKSEDLATFNYGEYIKDLTAFLFRSYSLDSSRIRLELDVGDIMLDTDTAVHCGLIINELVSNSMKHAFPDESAGCISISFNNDGSDNYSLIVKDDGVGIKDNALAENKGTLGMQLIETLTDQLDGNIDISNDNGTSFKIQFSLKKKS